VSAGKPELWSHSGREFTQQKYSGLEETPQPEDEEG
jgi:hypothetical protein